MLNPTVPPTGSPANAALVELQRLMREPPAFEAGVAARRTIADGLPPGVMPLTREQLRAIADTEQALRDDAVFEHLKDHIKDAVWLFA